MPDALENRRSPSQEPSQQQGCQLEQRHLWGSDRQCETRDLVNDRQTADRYLGRTPEGGDFFAGAAPVTFASDFIIAS